jgi:hypothetical protein
MFCFQKVLDLYDERKESKFGGLMIAASNCCIDSILMAFACSKNILCSFKENILLLLEPLLTCKEGGLAYV